MQCTYTCVNTSVYRLCINPFILFHFIPRRSYTGLCGGKLFEDGKAEERKALKVEGGKVVERQEEKIAVKAVQKTWTKPEAKPAIKPESKPPSRPELKPAAGRSRSLSKSPAKVKKPVRTFVVALPMFDEFGDDFLDNEEILQKINRLEYKALPPPAVTDRQEIRVFATLHTFHQAAQTRLHHTQTSDRNHSGR